MKKQANKHGCQSENRDCNFKYFLWARCTPRHLTSRNGSTLLQCNVPRWECLHISSTQGLLSNLNLLLGIRSLCSAHTIFKTWLNFILAQLLNYSKSLKKLLSSLLQSHPVSVTSLWLSILTLIFRNILSFVSTVSYQAISQITRVNN